MFSEMWQERDKAFKARVLKYSSYVFNDHLAILLFLGMGVFFMAYANWLKSLQGLSLIQSIFLGLLVWAYSHLGGIHTYVEEADLFFLAPAHDRMMPYLKRGIKGSLPFSLLLVGLLLLVLSPLMGASQVHPLLSLATLAGICLLHKAGLWSLTWASWTRLEVRSGVKILYEVFFFMIFMSFFVVGWWQLGLLLLAALLFGATWMYLGTLPRFLHWDLIYQAEANRQTRIYQAINWFVDVKELKTKPSRPKTYLDSLLPVLEGKDPSPYRYYLARKIVRQSGIVQAFLVSGGLSLMGPLMDLETYWILAWLVFSQFILVLSLFSLAKDQRRGKVGLADWTMVIGSDWMRTSLPIIVGQGLFLVLAFVLMGRAGQVGWALLAMGIDLLFMYLVLVPRAK